MRGKNITEEAKEALTVWAKCESISRNQPEWILLDSILLSLNFSMEWIRYDIKTCPDMIGELCSQVNYAIFRRSWRMAKRGELLRQ